MEEKQETQETLNPNIRKAIQMWLLNMQIMAQKQTYMNKPNSQKPQDLAQTLNGIDQATLSFRIYLQLHINRTYRDLKLEDKQTDGSIKDAA